MKKILTLCAALLLFGQSRISADPVAANSFPLPSKEEPLLAPEVMPSFRGEDMDRFIFWINSNLIYPEEALVENINGKVLTSFVIEKNGRLTNTEIMSSTDTLFSKEVIRVLKNCPKWNPGTVNGKPVRTKLIIPVTFHLPDKISDREKLPTFMGRSRNEFTKWVAERVNYPQEAERFNMKQVTVEVGFIVDENGRLKDIEILNDCSRAFSEEVIRVMKRSPKWKPASRDGKNCEVRLRVSLIFKPQPVTPNFTGSELGRHNL